jgi:predicted ATPase
MQRGEQPIEPQAYRELVRLRLGFLSSVHSSGSPNDESPDLGYAIALGFPIKQKTAFLLDPHIKYEAIWAHPLRPSSILVERRGSSVWARTSAGRTVLTESLGPFDSMLLELGDPVATPELMRLRQHIASWRFYDAFRVDAHSPARHMRVATFTPVLDAEGHALAAALQTIREIGDPRALEAAVCDAFPGAELGIRLDKENGLLGVEWTQHGLLRPLMGSELSDGTLRYLLLCAALLSPRPAPLLVLNEPETSLHPELLAPLARLIAQAAKQSQVWVVSHSRLLVEALAQEPTCQLIELEKSLGMSRPKGQSLLQSRAWKWPSGC